MLPEVRQEMQDVLVNTYYNGVVMQDPEKAQEWRLYNNSANIDEIRMIRQAAMTVDQELSLQQNPDDTEENYYSPSNQYSTPERLINSAQFDKRSPYSSNTTYGPRPVYNNNNNNNYNDRRQDFRSQRPQYNNDGYRSGDTNNSNQSQSRQPREKCGGCGMFKGMGIKDDDNVPAHRMGSCPYAEDLDSGYQLSKEKLAALQNPKEATSVIRHCAKYGCMQGYPEERILAFIAQVDEIRLRSGNDAANATS
jgi:hypothetical protein